MADGPSPSDGDGPPGEAPTDASGESGEGNGSGGTGGTGLRDTAGPTVLGTDRDGAGEVLETVSSEAARRVLDAVHEKPATASALAGRTDLALDDVERQLERLQAAGLVEVVGTDGEDGKADVYGPRDGPVVIVPDDERGDDVRSALSRLASATGLLAVASLLVQEVLGGGVGTLLGGPSAGGAAAGALQPGVAFFAGGLVVVLGWVAAGYLRS